MGAQQQAVVQTVIPQDIDAEKSVLGAVLLDNTHYNAVAEVIKPQDFLLEAHQRIFQLMGEMLDRSQPVDLLTMTAELRKLQFLDRVGGAAYVASLVDGVPRLINARHYAGLVKEKSALRAIMETAQAMREGSVRGGQSPEELLEDALGRLFRIAEGSISGGFVSLRDIIHSNYPTAEAVYEQAEESSGVLTGFTELDEATMGFHPANLVVIAARPSVGKTSFCLNVCEHTSVKNSKTVGIFSLEMSREELALRLLCSEARVNLQQLRRRAIGREEKAKLSMAFGSLLDARIFIDDTPSVTVTEMRAKSRRLKMEHGLDMVIIDHLQLVGTRGRYENRNQEISAMTRSLKGLAKELEIPVVCISQLSRSPESRTDKRPQLSDLRESGAIEQDADLVCFLYRDELYNPKEDNRGMAELIISKNRNGPAGQTVKLAFIAEYTRFDNYAPGYF